MPGAAAERRMTVAEFLTWDDGTDTRYELIDGVPVAMAPSRRVHGILQARLAALLDSALKGREPCAAVTEAGIAINADAQDFYIADIAITCEADHRESSFASAPILIVEVLSATTDADVRTVKLPAYRRMPSVQEIVLLDSRRPFAEVHRRLDGDRGRDRWIVDLVVGVEAPLRLGSIAAQTTLGELWRGLADGDATGSAGR